MKSLVCKTVFGSSKTELTISGRLSSTGSRFSGILKSLKQLLINTMEMGTRELSLEFVYNNFSSLFWYHVFWPFLGRTKEVIHKLLHHGAHLIASWISQLELHVLFAVFCAVGQLH